MLIRIRDGRYIREPRRDERWLYRRDKFVDKFSSHSLLRFPSTHHPGNSSFICELIIACLVFRMLRSNERGASILKLFRGFFSFLPFTLVRGYIYLKKYTRRFQHSVYHAHNLAHIYLACCLLALKYHSDHGLRNSELITGWNISISEFNFIEGLVLNGLEYNLCLADEEIEEAKKELHVVSLSLTNIELNN